MKLTTKGHYAVTAMLDLALHSDDRPIRLADISSRHNISVSYLEQLFTKFRRHDLVTSVRGPGGGYRLSRDSKDIFVAQVIDAINEDTHPVGRRSLADDKKHLANELWGDLSGQIHKFLSEISLASLVESRNYIVDST